MRINRVLKYKQWLIVSGVAAHQIRRDAN